jgi:hypothetical protein
MSVEPELLEVLELELLVLLDEVELVVLELELLVVVEELELLVVVVSPPPLPVSDVPSVELPPLLPQALIAAAPSTQATPNQSVFRIDKPPSDVASRW